MRVLALALVAVALPASAVQVDPKGLVLQQADVPRGFVVDRDETGLRTNAAEVRDEPKLAPLFRKWKRMTGYEAQYDRGEVKIESRVDVFASRAGARQILDWYDREVRKAGLGGLRRAAGSVGEQAWIYEAPFPAPSTIVVWRHGRVFAGVLGEKLGRERTLSLARAQQLRIAAALG